MTVKPAPFTVESSRVLYADGFVRHRGDRVVTERGHVIENFHVLEFPDWIQVVALTPGGELVMVEEYRHAGGVIQRGLPAGIVDPGEAPADTAARELAEESGHRAEAWIPLPPFWANPAIQTNRVHGFIALDAVPGAGQSLDPGETIEVMTLPAAAVIADALAGRFQVNGLHLASLLAAREHARRHATDDPRLAPLAAELD